MNYKIEKRLQRRSTVTPHSIKIFTDVKCTDIEIRDEHDFSIFFFIAKRGEPKLGGMWPPGIQNIRIQFRQI